MKGIVCFEPNEATHAEFAAALRDAHRNGVQIWAYDCIVGEGTVIADSPVEVRL
jgi:sugar fermentation stimulation protein A